MTILIVEDNEKNLKIVRDLMQYDGYQTLEARDGKIGLEMALAHVPDLILMDVQLPEMDGYTVTRQLRTIEKTQTIPIIAITSLAMKGESERALEAGCSAYLSKPITIKGLRDVVEVHLPGVKDE